MEFCFIIFALGCSFLNIMAILNNNPMNARANRAMVALQAGVSESTVSRALNNSPLIRVVIRDRVARVARELGYVPDKQASLLAKGRTCRLGFVVRTFRSFQPFTRSYFPAVLDGAILGAEQRGYSITVILDPFLDQAKELDRVVQSREVDGLLIPATSSEDPRIPQLLESKIPFVLINNCAPACNTVYDNCKTGMEKAIRYAKDMGHLKIGYIEGDLAYLNARDRLSCFKSICEELQVKHLEERGDFSRTSGYSGAGRLLNSPFHPTLLMTACDRQALGALDYCRDHRISVPESISIIGYDNMEPAKDAYPSLSTVENPITQSGHEATNILCDILEGKLAGPVQKWLDTDFVIRKSSGINTVQNVKTD